MTNTYGDDPFDERDNLPPTEYCPKCEENKPFTGKHKVNQDRVDPSEIYELTCGHWVL